MSMKVIMEKDGQPLKIDFPVDNPVEVIWREYTDDDDSELMKYLDLHVHVTEEGIVADLVSGEGRVVETMAVTYDKLLYGSESKNPLGIAEIRKLLRDIRELAAMQDVIDVDVLHAALMDIDEKCTALQDSLELGPNVSTGGPPEERKETYRFSCKNPPETNVSKQDPLELESNELGGVGECFVIVAIPDKPGHGGEVHTVDMLREAVARNRLNGTSFIYLEHERRLVCPLPQPEWDLSKWVHFEKSSSTQSYLVVKLGDILLSRNESEEDNSSPSSPTKPTTPSDSLEQSTTE